MNGKVGSMNLKLESKVNDLEAIKCEHKAYCVLSNDCNGSCNQIKKFYNKYGGYEYKEKLCGSNL